MKITRRKLRKLIQEVLTESTSEEDMVSFVVKRFIGPGEHSMRMVNFDNAFEDFEVRFGLQYPDSLFKIHDILLEKNADGMADKLVQEYPHDFEARDELETGDGELSEPESRELKALVGDAIEDAIDDSASDLRDIVHARLGEIYEEDVSRSELDAWLEKQNNIKDEEDPEWTLVEPGKSYSGWWGTDTLDDSSWYVDGPEDAVVVAEGVSEGTATSEMPQAWRQILGNILD